MTGGKFFSISPTTRRKALFVLVATFIFACLGLVTTLAAGRPLQLGLSTAILIGLGIGLFEEFYVQSERGNWLRNMHPLRSILVYVCVIILFYLISAHLIRVLLGRLDDLPNTLSPTALRHHDLHDIFRSRRVDGARRSLHRA
jgi:adenylate cyclase